MLPGLRSYAARLGLRCCVRFFEDDMVISPKDIIAHAAFRARSASIFHIAKEIVVATTWIGIVRFPYTKDTIAHVTYRVRLASTFDTDRELVLFHHFDQGRNIPLYN